MAEYIDREALMKFPIRRDHYDRKNGNEHFINGIESVLEYAENLPAADVAPVRHGKWIHPKGYVVSNGFLCSECGHEEASQLVINRRPGGYCIADDNGNFFYPPKINYCPNCGARMNDA